MLNIRLKYDLCNKTYNAINTYKYACKYHKCTPSGLNNGIPNMRKWATSPHPS